MKVKICANKNIYDAESCLLAGADIVGLLVGQKHTSNDFIDKETAKQIVKYVNGRCDTSLVTHLKEADEIIELTRYIGNNIIQLHSNIEESEVEKIKKNLLNIKLVRLIHVSKNGEVVTNIENIKYADYYILDSYNINTNQVGGTGISFDWKKSKNIIKKLNKPVFIAGGLTPENVKNVVKILNPYGVDVNSGCKVNGIKNRNKVIEFVKNAKGR